MPDLEMHIARQSIESAGDNRLGSRFVGIQEIHAYNEDDPRRLLDYRGIHLAKPCVHVVPYTDREEFVLVTEPRPLACRPNDNPSQLVVPRFFNFPGGFANVDLNDRKGLQDEAAREALEEAGITGYHSINPLYEPYEPYPQLSNEQNLDFLATGAELGERIQNDEPTERGLSVVTMPLRQIQDIISGRIDSEVRFSGPTLATLFLAQTAINA